MRTKLLFLSLSVLLCFKAIAADIIGTNAIHWQCPYSTDGGMTWTNLVPSNREWTNQPVWSTNEQLFYRSAISFAPFAIPPGSTNHVVVLDVYESTNCYQFPDAAFPGTNASWSLGKVFGPEVTNYIFAPFLEISNVITFNDLCTNCDSLVYEQQQDALFSDDDWWIIEPPEEF